MLLGSAVAGVYLRGPARVTLPAGRCISYPPTRALRIPLPAPASAAPQAPSLLSARHYSAPESPLRVSSAISGAAAVALLRGPSKGFCWCPQGCLGRTRLPGPVSRGWRVARGTGPPPNSGRARGFCSAPAPCRCGLYSEMRKWASGKSP